jgi:hypothetical protein
MADEMMQAQIEAAAERYAAAPYRMNIFTETETTDESGNVLESASTVKYENVPVMMEVQGNVSGRDPAEPATVNNRYLLSFPVNHEGERIELDQEVDLLKVLAIGSEPDRIFEIEVQRNPKGIEYFVIAIEP